MELLTTFPRIREFEKARTLLDTLGLSYEVISPGIGYAKVGVPSLAVNSDGQIAIWSDVNIISSGWVDYRPSRITPPAEEPAVFAEDIFGEASIMVLAPCVADAAKIRFTAHISGNMAEMFPYLNSEMRQCSYNLNNLTLTFMDGCRLITLYPQRIAVAKADEIVDAWRTLEHIRRLVNSVWARRDEIKPSTIARQRPPALEIYKRLPGTNCRQCGEKTCMAFAMRLWRGEGNPAECKPVFAGDYKHLQAPLMEICAGLVSATA